MMVLACDCAKVAEKAAWMTWPEAALFMVVAATFGFCVWCMAKYVS